jgi:spermidine synthase
MLFPSEGVAQQTSEKMLYEKNSLYQYIRVIEDIEKKERYLLNSKRSEMQGGIYVATPEKLHCEYTQLSFISLTFLNRSPEDVLFIGLGAGSMPGYFSKYYPKANIDIVEIDPEILKVAKEFFDFRESANMNLHISDGRVFVKRTPKKYDLIFLDEYQSGHIPFHLTTVEFLKEVKSKLNDGGVVVSNIIADRKNKFFLSMIKTYIKEFPHLYNFKGRTSDNYIFVATTNGAKKEQINVWMDASRLLDTKKLDIDLPLFAQDSYGYYTDFEMAANILTDDYAPVNLLR